MVEQKEKDEWLFSISWLLLGNKMSDDKKFAVRKALMKVMVDRGEQS